MDILQMHPISAPLAWTEGEPGPGFLKGHGPEGDWTLYPVRQDNAAELKFTGSAATVAQWQAAHPGDPRAQHGWPSDLGFVYDHATGIQVVERLRTQPAGLDMESALQAAGFKKEGYMVEEAQVFRRSLDRKGAFSLFVAPDRLWLIFESRGREAEGWINLLAASISEPLQDGTTRPILWPSLPAPPVKAALSAALLLADTWQPRPRAKPTSRPNPIRRPR